MQTDDPINKSIPATLPPPQTGPMVWYGPAMVARTDQWCLDLTQSEVAEIEAAAGDWLHLNGEIASITATAFPLPTLKPRLAQLARELISGRGFGVLRGLPVEQYDERMAAAMFFGLGSHLGHPRSQNAQGHVLGHVRDLGVRSDDPEVRIYQTRERQTFHTDSSDVVGLLCLKTARSGGDSLLVSASTLFNEMRQRRPDLLHLLMQPVATDRRGEVPEGMAPYFLIPVFSWYRGFLTVMYQRQYIESAQRFDDAPRLTQQHREALDLFDALANDPALNLSMTLQPGDMQFVNNHALLHDRTGFEDWPDPGRKRHLFRLWLSMAGDRPLPEVFATRFGSVQVGDRGGIVPAVNT